MIIGIDGNEANQERKVGIGEYAYELLTKFREFSTLRQARGEQVQFRVYLKESPRPEMPKEGPNWKYIIVKPKKLWTQIGLPLYLYSHFPRPDVFFSPTHYAPRFSPIPTVISIMDLSFLHFPELFAKKDLYQLKNWTKYSAKKATRIFTISNASRDDILKEYGVKPDRVVVTYPGIKEMTNIKYQISNIKKIQEKFGIGESYILFVGTLQPRKNIVRLIESFSLIVRGPAARQPQKVHQSSSFPAGTFRGSPSRVTPGDLQLVIVGKKGWLYEEILEAPKKYGVENEVKFLDFVSDDDLPSLYHNALCYVLPSLYEGFGLPVVEAMRYGTPVITSNVSSLPEAGGDAALYVDPLDAKDIAEKIEKVIASKKLREEMVKKGYAHIKKFSWEKAARETLKVLQEVGGK